MSLFTTPTSRGIMPPPGSQDYGNKLTVDSFENFIKNPLVAGDIYQGSYNDYITILKATLGEHIKWKNTFFPGIKKIKEGGLSSDLEKAIDESQKIFVCPCLRMGNKTPAGTPANKMLVSLYYVLINDFKDKKRLLDFKTSDHYAKKYLNNMIKTITKIKNKKMLTKSDEMYKKKFKELIRHFAIQTFYLPDTPSMMNY